MKWLANDEVQTPSMLCKKWTVPLVHNSAGYGREAIKNGSVDGADGTVLAVVADAQD